MYKVLNMVGGAPMRSGEWQPCNRRPPKTAPCRPPVPPANSNRLRVLVVDDEEDLRHLVGTAVKFEGMAVTTAADGGEALSPVRREQFDVVVLDVMLPDLDGFEVLRRVKEMPSGPSVSFLTARDDVDDRIRGLTQGADDDPGKPFSVGELVARVQAVSRSGRGVRRQLCAHR